ncbi:CRISPR-associated RAMP protein Csx10 [Chamaesiphon sp.]|uniref:type III-D CRISPR-associated RAMP protein Csx10 n=1 Tax=Chamaesiphon sp. TaxID=2814140 RepID=UPI0035944C22
MIRINLEITAHSPLAIGRQKPGGSISEVETYIPGSVIRGAIAGLMIREARKTGTDFANDPDSDFKTLFIDGGGIFQNAYPAIADLGDRLQVNSDVRVLPATALSAKGKPGFKPKGNGVFDSTIDRFYADLFGQVYDPNCPKDGGRVDPYKVFYSRSDDRYLVHSTSTRLLTRAGINRRRATAEDQLLYSIQVLDEVKCKNGKDVSMAFCGSILVVESIAEDFYDYLKRNAQNLRLGGSTSRGLGKVSLKLPEKESLKLQPTNLSPEKEEPKDPSSDLRERLGAFNTAFQNRWRLWRMFDRSVLDPTIDRTYFTIGLQSEAILTERWQRSIVISPAILQTAAGNLSGEVKLEAAYSSYDYRSGWNNAWGLMKDTELVTDRGSVYLFSVESAHQEEWIAALTNLENRGIGDRTMEGFGQVRVCDEFHRVFREEAV